jgi:plasmid stabilization system protein ParE
VKWEFHPQARQELDESADWYESQKPGLGLRFLDEVEEVIGRILKSPEKWRKIDVDVRRCLMDSFPFTIFYRIRGTFVEILAVSHHGRRPGYWKPRL